MDKKLKKKWLKELDRYKKGRRALRRPKRNTFCCLGVLLDICEEGQWDENRKGYYYDMKWDDSVPPRSLSKKLGILDHLDELIKLNDNYPGWDKVKEYITKNL